MIDIITEVKAQNWPAGQFAVFGSGPMQMLGIRPSNDIDIVATAELYETLKLQGWREVYKHGDRCLTRGYFEVFDVWDFEYYHQTAAKLIAMSEFIQGVPFVPLAEVMEFKTTIGRPKDLRDIVLISEYQRTRHHAGIE